MEKLLGRFSYRWSTYPGSIHHQMEDIQPQNFSCATDYFKSLFHLHKSMPTDHAHLDTWNTHTTTICTCQKEESGFLFAKRKQVSVHGVTSCQVFALLVQSKDNRDGKECPKLVNITHLLQSSPWKIWACEEQWKQQACQQKLDLTLAEMDGGSNGHKHREPRITPRSDMRQENPLLTSRPLTSSATAVETLRRSSITQKYHSTLTINIYVSGLVIGRRT